MKLDVIDGYDLLPPAPDINQVLYPAQNDPYQRQIEVQFETIHCPDGDSATDSIKTDIGISLPMSVSHSQCDAVTVAAMYRFVSPAFGTHPTIETLACAIRDRMSSLCVLGTVILAQEGLNATVAGDIEDIESFVRYLRTDTKVFGGLSDLEPQYSFCPEMPFSQIIVKVRPEIVTMRKPGADPSARVGTYVPASEWNALIDDPGVLVIDARNDFEVRLGTFVSSGGRPAINPGTGSFAEFPDFVGRELAGMQDRTLALFCTGGIRCERATSYLLSLGFSDVRHLKGGVLSYLKATLADESRWNGGCFVFDGRVTLGHGLVPSYAL